MGDDGQSAALSTRGGALKKLHEVRTSFPPRKTFACSDCISLSASRAFSALLSCKHEINREWIRAAGTGGGWQWAHTIQTPTVALSTRMRTMTMGSMKCPTPFSSSDSSK